MPIPKFIVWEFFILGFFYFIIFLFFNLRETGFHSFQGNISRNFLKGIAFGLCLIFFGFGLLRVNGIEAENLQGDSLSTKIGYSYFNNTRDKLREIINTNLPNPQSAILAGILLGDKASFSKDWKQKLSNTGTSHIVAVSGMNIVMLSTIFVGLGVSLGLYRGQALWFSLVFVWIFIALIGFQVSAIRAGVMGSILIFCQILGRKGASFRALALAVAIMLAVNPALLRYSLSFQLSVLATLGLIQISPVIELKLKKIKVFEKTGFSPVIAASLAAQIFTMPLLVYSFGYISLVGLLVNLLIVPLLPFVMISGIVFLVGALIYAPLGIILSWLVGLLLSFVVWIIDIFSKVPFAVLKL